MYGWMQPESAGASTESKKKRGEETEREGERKKERAEEVRGSSTEDDYF
jgi:hypothetical protein